MSDENWILIVAPAVHKALKRFPRSDQATIDVAVVRMCGDPYFGDTQKLGGENAWRRRVGSYRISYEVRQDLRTVLVFEIKRRTSTTY